MSNLIYDSCIHINIVGHIFTRLLVEPETITLHCIPTNAFQGPNNNTNLVVLQCIRYNLLDKTL